MGDCHYLDGNVKAETMFGITQELVTMLGIGSERLRLEWISGAEGIRFAEVAKEFTEQVKSIGPSELKNVA